MSRELEPAEIKALRQSEGLLRFAAENVKELPAKPVATICGAMDSAAAKTWDQAVAAEFWLAFNALCALIKPVTIESLSTNLDEPRVAGWRFWDKTGTKPAASKLAARRYMYLLYFLLIAAAAISFASATASTLASDIQKLIEAGDKLLVNIEEAAQQLETTVGSRDFTEVKDPEDRKLIVKTQAQIQEQNYLLDRMFQKIRIETILASFGLSPLSYDLGNLQPDMSVKAVRETINNYLVSRRAVVAYLTRDSIIVGILNTSLLPIILGLMGACAYVVRLISDQIRDTTFSTTSPTRHKVRLALGALAGVVVGYGGFATTASLSPLALAFIAGYAVEPVFATFDAIAAKFR